MCLRRRAAGGRAVTAPTLRRRTRITPCASARPPAAANPSSHPLPALLPCPHRTTLFSVCHRDACHLATRDAIVIDALPLAILTSPAESSLTAHLWSHNAVNTPDDPPLNQVPTPARPPLARLLCPVTVPQAAQREVRVVFDYGRPISAATSIYISAQLFRSESLLRYYTVASARG